MRQANLMKVLLVCILILGVAAYFLVPLATSIKQGLDLQGGTHVLLEAQDTPESQVDEDALLRTVKILEQRINELGLTEPIIQRQGTRRIIVELPGIKEPEKAIELIGRTALLEFKDESGTTVLTGKDLKEAKAEMTSTKQVHVAIGFTDEGSKKFADVTKRSVGKKIAIILDGKVLTDPVVQQEITGGSAVITGQRDLNEAQELAILLRSGALPVKLDVLETRTVGPTLGQDSKDKSVKAFSIGVAAILIFMVLFYRMSGIIANIALVLYVLILLFALKMLQATLTLPGIAGVILSIGMAVDANVLIFERFKEEFRSGKTLRAAMDAGFNRAFSTILDANLTTLLVAAVLFFLGGSGAIKGFAVTLGLGIIISMFTAILITRFLLKELIYSNITKSGKFFGL